MRHEWERHPDSCTTRRPFQEIRVCKNCKNEQKRFQQQSWGRVTGYAWYPLIGRCQGKGKKNERR